MDWILASPHGQAYFMLAARLMLAFLLGCIGGITLSLIQLKGGLEIPNCYQAPNPSDPGAKQRFIDLGFLSELLVGGIAGIVVFCLRPAGGLLHVIAYSLLAGIGGGSLLLSFANALRLRSAQKEIALGRERIRGLHQTLKIMRESRGKSDVDAVHRQLDILEKNLELS